MSLQGIPKYFFDKEFGMNKNKTTNVVDTEDDGIIISLKSISKEFNGEQVLSEISLDIHDNEFVTLLGPSGCGVKQIG